MAEPFISSSLATFDLIILFLALILSWAQTIFHSVVPLHTIPEPGLVAGGQPQRRQEIGRLVQEQALTGRRRGRAQDQERFG